MKAEFNFVRIFLLVCVCMMIQAPSLSAQLIEPSRTLEGRQKRMARISMFSEPPELTVFLDGVDIGSTPVISKELTPGVHILRIKDTEKEMFFPPGKTLQLDFYKDSLIEIPETKAESTPQPESVEKTMPREKETDDFRKDREQYQPFYWPLNSRGPIR